MMKFTVFLTILIFFNFVFANESVQLKAGFNIYRCYGMNCPTPISELNPLTIELEHSGPDSLAMIGNTTLSQTRNGVEFLATIQVIKILSGPHKGYLVQINIAAAKNGSWISTKQVGFVHVESISKINRIDWQDEVRDEDLIYLPSVSIGPID